MSLLVHVAELSPVVQLRALHKVLLNFPTALCAADGKAQMTDWTTFELNPTVIQRVASSTSPLAANAATVIVAELTVR